MKARSRLTGGICGGAGSTAARGLCFGTASQRRRGVPFASGFNASFRHLFSFLIIDEKIDDQILLLAHSCRSKSPACFFVLFEPWYSRTQRYVFSSQMLLGVFFFAGDLSLELKIYLTLKQLKWLRLSRRRAKSPRRARRGVVSSRSFRSPCETSTAAQQARTALH
jgi:hypothetical protein